MSDEGPFGPGPHFLCIGAQKAGTTWLHRNLVCHPDVWLPPIKEIHYFDGRRSPVVVGHLRQYLQRVERGEIRRVPERFEFARRLMRDEPKDDRWYLSLFEFAHGRLCGDMTPAYGLLDRKAVARIHDLLPSCRILFVMRDPVERAWSQAKMELRREKLDPAAMPPAELMARLDDPGLRLRGSYMRIVAIWESLYPRAQIGYFFYDHVTSRPGEFLKEVCHFLGLTYDAALFAGTVGRVYNRTPPIPMPPAVRRHLSLKFLIEIETLAARFGGPARAWLASCEAAIREKPRPGPGAT